MEWLELDRWSPYAVGIGLGILSWLSFLLSDQALACSTAFTRSAGMLERAVRGPFEALLDRVRAHRHIVLLSRPINGKAISNPLCSTTKEHENARRHIPSCIS